VAERQGEDHANPLVSIVQQANTMKKGSTWLPLLP
jgi:hypothetical protein